MSKIQLIDKYLSCVEEISVLETDDRFIISWLGVPVEAPNQVIAGWVEALRRR